MRRIEQKTTLQLTRLTRRLFFVKTISPRALAFHDRLLLPTEQPRIHFLFVSHLCQPIGHVGIGTYFQQLLVHFVQLVLLTELQGNSVVDLLGEPVQVSLGVEFSSALGELSHSLLGSLFLY